jgi:hypothetical protein
MTPDEVELMKVLCQQIATEKDNNRFSQLIFELNELLERTNKRLDSPPNTDPRPQLVKGGRPARMPSVTQVRD